MGGLAAQLLKPGGRCVLLSTRRDELEKAIERSAVWRHVVSRPCDVVAWGTCRPANWWLSSERMALVARMPAPCPLSTKLPRKTPRVRSLDNVAREARRRRRSAD